MNAPKSDKNSATVKLWLLGMAWFALVCWLVVKLVEKL
jgi:hypothetical protein